MKKSYLLVTALSLLLALGDGTVRAGARTTIDATRAAMKGPENESQAKAAAEGIESAGQQPGVFAGHLAESAGRVDGKEAGLIAGQDAAEAEQETGTIAGKDAGEDAGRVHGKENGLVDGQDAGRFAGEAGQEYTRALDAVEAGETGGKDAGRFAGEARQENTRAFDPAEAADSAAGHPTLAIGTVVVTGTRNRTDIRHLPMTVTIVDREEIEAASQPSLLPLLTEQVPGLFTTARSTMGYGVSGGAAGQMSLRGIGGPAQEGVPTTGLLVLIDGHPQYMGLMGHPVADAYQSFMAERVEVLRGPASVLYGSNAMGGVINIVTRKEREDGVRTNVNLGYGSYNTLQTEATNRIRAGRFTSVVSGSYNRTDGHRADMGFEQYGGYAKVGYELSSAWNIRADVNLTHFNASNPGRVDAPLLDNDQRITRGMTSLAVENDYEKTSGALSLFYNWGRHRIDNGYHPGEQPQDYLFRSHDDMLGVSWYQSMQLFAGNRLTVGVDWFRFGGASWNQPRDGGKRAMSADKVQHETAGYVDFRQHVAPWLTLDAGLRADHHSHVGTEWVPQAGLAFHLPKNTEIKLSASKGFRYPTIRELYMFRPANPDLRPERLWNYELSFAQRTAEGRLSYGVNIFYINGENLILRIPVDGRQMNVNSGRIENAGAEAQVAYRFSAAWKADANYSYLHMAHPVLASPEHKLYAGASFTKGRWSLATGMQYVAGLFTQVKLAGAGSERQEDFVLWNLSGRFRAARRIEVWARGENLLAQRYELNAGFPMPRATVTAGVNIDF